MAVKQDCSENKPYYDDPFPEYAGESGIYTVDQVLCNNYVRVKCKDNIIIQIRIEILAGSQLLNLLQEARSPANLAECIHIAEDLGTSKRIKLFCDWINTHLNFDKKLGRIIVC